MVKMTPLLLLCLLMLLHSPAADSTTLDETMMGLLLGVWMSLARDQKKP
jgi:hypothetical protein